MTLGALTPGCGVERVTAVEDPPAGSDAGSGDGPVEPACQEVDAVCKADNTNCDVG
jgi:hypothetical protein